MKKVKVRTPSGRTIIRIKRERYGIAVCASCRKPLHGVVQGRKSPKTDKRPSRRYGGYFCSSCVKEIFKDKGRMI